MTALKSRLALIAALAAAFATAAAAAPPVRQTEGGAYTRYELLAPDSHKFRIVYEITAMTPGATAYYNPVRPGSIASDEHVFDRATGKPLVFKEVGADEARAGGVPDAEPGSRYIAVTLAHPVPEGGGGGRILIDKTYEDAKSYHRDGDAIVFNRPLGIKRNTVVLPAGYRLAACNVPSQVLQQPDGRIAISFVNTSPSQAPLVLRATPGAVPAGPSSLARKFDDRAAQSREIVYYLRQPETHAFDLTHDYTETKPGVAAYVNIVRTGSTASNPSARDLDTGATMPPEYIKGAAITALEPDAADVTATTTAVVFRFAAVEPGTSRRLRIAETYTDPDRYGLSGDELVWHRSFGRPANAVILPAGWLLTNSSVPAAITTISDGRVRLDFVNPRNDEIDVILTARRAR
nr:hypothetical protein [Polymorphobacter sp.]